MMDTYKVKLTGETPLLMHWDNIDWCEVMQRWAKDPANKKDGVAGDDRTPAFRWLGRMYHEAGRVVIPSDNLMTVLREGGSKVLTGKKGATFKRLTQSGLLVNESAWRLTIDGAEIDAAALIAKLKNEADFEVHKAEVEKLGFSLFVKRARVNQTKHIRVRPRFDRWEISGTISVLEDNITKDILQTILTYAGVQCGIGDWRPSSPKSPGPFGRFVAEVKRQR